MKDKHANWARLGRGSEEEEKEMVASEAGGKRENRARILRLA